ncbi:MAG: YceI family protein [Flavobacteriales bacterium]
MKKIFFFGVLVATSLNIQAQKFFTKDGTIRFFSNAKLEKIEATNNKASIVYDAASGAIEIATIVKGFVFENAFMGEHFNETYIESDKFPKANFKGKLENPSSVNVTIAGTYKAKVVGDLTMHGVTKPVSTEATFVVGGGKIDTDAKFSIKASDFGINIPGDKADNISNVIEITCKSSLTELKK